MIAIVQVLTIIAGILVVIKILTSRRSHHGKAWKKLGLIGLSISMIVAILIPEQITALANVLGVGRGADLVTYGLAVAFILYALNAYLQQQDHKRELHNVARSLAILAAREKYKIK